MDESVFQALVEARDEKYAAFQRKLLPTLTPESILGVRAPVLRRFAKGLKGEQIGSLPHQYYEENMLHAYWIAGETDFIRCLEQVNAFLPFIDNWAICDQLRPGVFRKHKEQLLPHVQRWLRTNKTYTRRFAIVMLMQHYLKEDFSLEYLQWVADINSEEYYVNMAIAWFFATALFYRWEETLPFLYTGTLSPWIHNKTIQKARESRMLSSEQKAVLLSLKKEE